MTRNATQYGARGLRRDVVVAGHRIADGSIAGTGIGLPSREDMRELQPLGLRGITGRRGILDEMQGHPRIGAAVRNMRVEMQRQKTTWEPLDEGSAEQAEFIAVIEQMIQSDRIVTDQYDVGSNWGNVLGWLVDDWVYGFALANPSWSGDLLEVFPVMPSTVRRWDIDRTTGEWVSVHQRTDQKAVTIPRGALIYVRTQGAPGELEGHSMLRPVVAAYENWKITAAAVTMIMGASSGVLDIKAPKSGADTEDWQSLEDQAVAFEQGLRRWFMHEDGYEIDLSFPASGATSGLVEVMQYWDAQIDQALGRSMQSLGFTATGSRALGEELSEESQEQARANLQVLLRRFGVSLGATIAERVGYDGPLPTLSPLVERKREVSARVDVLGAALQAGLIRWTPERERELSEELDLPDIAEEENVLPVSPESLDAEETSAGCCGHERLAARTQVEDVDGETFEFDRDLHELERFVSWVRNETVRLAQDDRLARRIAEIANQHRDALWSVLPDEVGPVPNAVERVSAEFRPRYEAAIHSYAIRVASDVAAQARDERRRQVGEDGARTFEIIDIDAIDSKMGGRLEAAKDEAATVIASRVQGRLVDHWMQGGTAADYEHGQTQLHREATTVGNLIESQGRLMNAYSEGLEEGVVPVEAIRTSVRDDRRCGVCASRDLRSFDLTTASGIEEMLAEELPDPDCEGAPRCRCGYVLRYRRVSGEEYRRIRENIGPVLAGAA